jgi:hypothetical protein
MPHIQNKKLPRLEKIFDIKSFLCLLVVGIFVFGSNVSSVLAQDQPLPQTIPQSSPTYANLVIFNIIHTFSCFAVGSSVIQQPCVEYKVLDNFTNIKELTPVLSSSNTSQGALGFVSSTIGSLYSSPPVSTSEFTAHLGDDLGLIKTAHAQVGGSGNGVLSPVYALWVVSRNLCYLLMIIIFLSVGLMIMFRQKINPQTVISVQTALPGLVLGLIFITFSYFLSSLITDFAFVGTDLVGFFFQQAQGQPSPPQSLLAALSTHNPLTIIPRFIDSAYNVDYSIGINQLFNSFNPNGPAQYALKLGVSFLAFQYGSQAGQLAAGPVSGLVGALGLFGGPAVAGSLANGTAGIIPATVGAAAALAAYNDPGYFFSWIIWLVLIVMLGIAMFRLLFVLIKNYLSIIFYTVASPFFFLAASLPGRSGIINEWIRNMLCLVLSFPAVIAVIYFAYFLLTSTNGNALAVADKPFLICPATSNLFARDPSCLTPNFGTSAQTMPLFGGLNLNLINFLLAFGAIIATPSIPDIICKAIGKIGPYGQMIEQSITGAQKDAQGRIQNSVGQAGKFGGKATELFDKPEWHPITDKATGKITGWERVYKPGGISRVWR